MNILVDVEKNDIICFNAYEKDEDNYIVKTELVGKVKKDFKEGYKFDKDLGHTLPVEWISEKFIELETDIYTDSFYEVDFHDRYSELEFSKLKNDVIDSLFENENKVFIIINYLYNDFDIEENKIRILIDDTNKLQTLVKLKKDNVIVFLNQEDMFNSKKQSYFEYVGYAKVKNDFDIENFDEYSICYNLEIEYIEIPRKSKKEFSSIIDLYDLYKESLIHTRIFNKNKNTILYGPPGTGKTYNTYNEVLKLVDRLYYNDCFMWDTRYFISYAIKELMESNQLRFCTFHQSYGYEEFIEGLKSDGNGNFVCEDGVLKEIAIDAMFNGLKIENKIIYEVKKDNLNETEKRKLRKQIVLEKIYDSNNFDFSKANNYVLVIDEINRGNISKIFGELITLIEDDKRLTTENEVLVKLPYSKESFCLPPNLYIVATMNTSDKSIALMDVALRRRFCFKEMMPNPSLLATVDDIKLDKMLDKINQRIEFLYDKDYMIGHAYFINAKNICDISKTFKNKIIPLLQEYFYDDFEKIGLVLGGIGNSENDDYIVYKKEINPSSLFKENFDYEIKTKYYIKENIGSKELKNIYE